MCLPLVSTFFWCIMKTIYEPEYVKQLFNRMSGSYERMNYIASFGFSIRWRKQFLNKLGTSTEQLEVIDLMSGLGENWKMLNGHFPNSCFCALDFSQQMTAQSEDKAQKIFHEHMTIRCEDILKNQLLPDSFDKLSCAFGLKTFNEEQLEILAREVKRILKPGGQFSFIEVSVPPNKLLLFFYRMYLKTIVPVIGKLFLGNPEDYKMLWIYTEQFQNARKTAEVFEKTGLSVNFDRYFFGCATGIYGSK